MHCGPADGDRATVYAVAEMFLLAKAGFLLDVSGLRRDNMPCRRHPEYVAFLKIAGNNLDEITCSAVNVILVNAPGFTCGSSVTYGVLVREKLVLATPRA